MCNVFKFVVNRIIRMGRLIRAIDEKLDEKRNPILIGVCYTIINVSILIWIMFPILSK